MICLVTKPDPDIILKMLMTTCRFIFFQTIGVGRGEMKQPGRGEL